MRLAGFDAMGARRRAIRAVAGLLWLAPFTLAAEVVGPETSGIELVHTLERGETAWGLSRRYRVPVKEIIRANRIENPRRLPIGLRVVIPGRLSVQAGAKLAAVDELLESAEDDLRHARFEDTLEAVAEIRGRLEPLARTTQGRSRLARGATAAATAEIAFGREEAALESAIRALEADPALTLDAETSPKVRDVFDRARARLGIDR